MTSHAAEATLTLQDKSLTLQGVPATDGADALAETDPQVTVLHRTEKVGLGAAAGASASRCR